MELDQGGQDASAEAGGSMSSVELYGGQQFDSSGTEAGSVCPYSLDHRSQIRWWLRCVWAPWRCLWTSVMAGREADVSTAHCVASDAVEPADQGEMQSVSFLSAVQQKVARVREWRLSSSSLEFQVSSCLLNNPLGQNVAADSNLIISSCFIPCWNRSAEPGLTLVLKLLTDWATSRILLHSP